MRCMPWPVMAPHAFTMNVTHVMTSPVPACTPEMTVSQAMARMTTWALRHLVVMDRDAMVGHRQHR